MATTINKKQLYEYLLKITILDENFEGAASVRDVLKTIKDDETVDIEDDGTDQLKITEDDAN